MKNNLVVRVVAKSHVVVIALNIYLAAGGAAIAKPSAVEAPAIPPRHERSEILNGGLQCHEVVTEKGVDVLGPSGRVRINGTKLSENGSAESCTSRSATIIEAVMPANVTSERGEKNGAKNWIGIGEEGFDNWLWVYVLIALSPIFMANAQAAPMKHNYERDGK